MNVLVKGKHLEVSDPLRAHIEKKIGKLDKYLENLSDAEVEVSLENTRNLGQRHVVQVTLHHNGTILRSEERAVDMYAAVDTVADKMHTQITRYKGKLYERGKAGRAQGEGTSAAEATGEITPEMTPTIVKVKRFSAEPMYSEEAIEQMELLGHDFHVFYNAADKQMNVVYRRRDGNYGLLQPERA